MMGNLKGAHFQSKSLMWVDYFGAYLACSIALLFLFFPCCITSICFVSLSSLHASFKTAKKEFLSQDPFRNDLFDKYSGAYYYSTWILDWYRLHMEAMQHPSLGLVGQGRWRWPRGTAGLRTSCCSSPCLLAGREILEPLLPFDSNPSLWKCISVRAPSYTTFFRVLS